MRAAADAGSARGLLNLGVMYRKGNGVEQDLEKSFALYKKAANLGNRIAAYYAAMNCEDGIGTAEDYAKALKWYEKAAEQDNEFAQRMCGMMYSSDGYGAPKNREKAIMWLEKAAEKSGTDAGELLEEIKSEEE